MRPRGIHCFEPSGSDFSRLVDAFHPSFPASVGDYISQPYDWSRDYPVHERSGYASHCLDGCFCQGDRFGHNAQRLVNNASVKEYSAGSDCTSDAHDYRVESPRDNLMFGNSGPLFKLPSEVSDLILSYLSPAALDAARHTCKDWRVRILSNTWVLSSILGVSKARSPSEGARCGNVRHRDLLKKLDCDSDLPSTSQHPDAWRTRFRTRNLEFSLPSPSPTLTRPTLIAAARAGTQNGFLAFQLQAQESSQRTKNHLHSTLVIYRFDSAELPWYAGTIHNVKGKGTFRITGVIDIRRHTEWVLRIEIGDTTGLYSLTTREAFSKSGPRFSLKVVESLKEVFGSTDTSAIQGFDRPPSTLPIGDQSWSILAPFPPNEGLRHVCFSEGLRRHTEPRFLAEQKETGDVYIIMRVDPSETPSQCGNPYFTGIALLSCPRQKSVYKNVAVAPATIKDGSIRAAIIWQTTNLANPISELYIYDIPEAVYYEPCKSYNQNLSVNAVDDNESATRRPYRLIQGKRVTSLPHHTGGLHPRSPLHQHASPHQIATGGLQFPHTTSNQEPYPQNVQYQKCIVWGPATTPTAHRTLLSLQVFDFSFADPQRMHSLTTTTCGALAGQQRRRRSHTLHNIALNSLHCACALHDDGFRIFLPDVTVFEACEPAVMIRREDAREEGASFRFQKTAGLKMESVPLGGGTAAWSFWWPWRATPAAPPDGGEEEEDGGRISRDDSVARRAALGRREEWLRGRIRGMKRAGLTEFEIAELWNASVWTRYGQVRKPEGWRGLGTVKGSGGEDDDELMVA